MCTSPTFANRVSGASDMGVSVAPVSREPSKVGRGLAVPGVAEGRGGGRADHPGLGAADPLALRQVEEALHPPDAWHRAGEVDDLIELLTVVQLAAEVRDAAHH